MLQALLNLLNTMLPMLYAVAAMNYSIDFFREDPFARRMSLPLLATTGGLHGVYLVLRIVMFEHFPVATVWEAMTVIAFALTVVYAFIEYETKSQKTGMFVLGFAFVFQTVASAFIVGKGPFPDALRSPLFAVHTGAAVLGYTAFAVSAIYGVLYLLLYHDLKSSRFGLIYQRLPSLDVLVRMSLRSTVLGVLFLTVTIAIGTLWAIQREENLLLDSKFISSVMVWAVYAIGLGLHYGFRWSGRRTIYVSLAAFVLMVSSMVTLIFWFPTFHRFA